MNEEKAELFRTNKDEGLVCADCGEKIKTEGKKVFGITVFEGICELCGRKTHVSTSRDWVGTYWD